MGCHIRNCFKNTCTCIYWFFPRCLTVLDLYYCCTVHTSNYSTYYRTVPYYCTYRTKPLWKINLTDWVGPRVINLQYYVMLVKKKNIIQYTVQDLHHFHFQIDWLRYSYWWSVLYIIYYIVREMLSPWYDTGIGYNPYSLTYCTVQYIVLSDWSRSSVLRRVPFSDL